MNVNEKIAALRAAMKEKGLDAYIIPSSDPHQSEYVADHWKSREWISGFTGSAGSVVITHDHAGLWTDARYFLQAEMQLASSEMVLHKLINQGAAEYVAWLSENLPEGSTVGGDGAVFSFNQVNSMTKSLKANGIKVNMEHDLIRDIWQDRPALPMNALFDHPAKFAGKSRSEKINEIRAIMKEEGAQYHLLNTLDDIAWTFNIRSNDVEFNPVAIAYAVIGEDKSYLFVEEEKVPSQLNTALEQDKIYIHPYPNINGFLRSISHSGKILFDGANTNVKLYDAIPEQCRMLGNTIPLELKAIKNSVEVEGIKKAMTKDGVALTRLFRWLENTLQNDTVSEVKLAERLAQFRSEQEGYHGESFAAIVGYRGNGAIIHYHAEPETCADIKAEGILLLDSGGQYDEGTTDITRTVALSPASEEEKRNFTLVLKGVISLSMIVFPEGTRGIQLDTLARQFLWRHRLNFGHGTGHGVGCFLNVHEPPQGFAPSLSVRGKTPFKAGMFSSNEPGFYKEGAYGMRIENLILSVQDESNDFGDFLRFDTLTLFPIDHNLIESGLLSDEEKRWLNDYHQKVYNKLSPFLNEEEKIWLAEKCKAL